MSEIGQRDWNWARVILALALVISILQPMVALGDPSLASRAKDEAIRVRHVEKLVREIAGMGAVGQLTRERFLALRKDAAPSERDQLDSVWRTEYQPFDVKNTRVLKELLRGRGWFRRSEVGTRGASAAFDIVQHSDDLDFQREVLRKMKPLLGTADLNGENYALLYDRVATTEKRPQRYGTQGSTCRAGKYAVPDDVEDVKNLDQRRAEMGMEPMADYLVRLDEMYGTCDEPTNGSHGCAPCGGVASRR